MKVQRKETRGLGDIMRYFMLLTRLPLGILSPHNYGRARQLNPPITLIRYISQYFITESTMGPAETH